MTRLLVEATLIVELPGAAQATLDEYPLLVEVSLPGRVEYQDVEVTPIVTPADARCDFCDSREPVFNYPARDFLSPEFATPGSAIPGSAGGWLACYPCARLIEDGEDVALAERGLEHSPMRWTKGNQRKVLVTALRQLHDQFRSHREGDREALA